ncbi:hypothetical protein PIB30_085195 [Stylosanthes scabra]|uniref:Uncharacterized protein n=1 Tax=Stylosanthes scabra TaxID=79078 RepID=A0ABU6URN1_9FABA|nr:hypothetical protein [Stylosanthes scabra]
MGGGGDDVFGGGYVTLDDDLLGDGTLSPHQLCPYFASPGTMERQLGGEVCFCDLAAMWAQDDGEASGSHQAVDPPQFHVGLNEPATGLHDPPPSAFYGAGPSDPPPSQGTEKTCVRCRSGLPPPKLYAQIRQPTSRMWTSQVQ